MKLLFHLGGSAALAAAMPVGMDTNMEHNGLINKHWYKIIDQPPAKRHIRALIHA